MLTLCTRFQQESLKMHCLKPNFFKLYFCGNVYMYNYKDLSCFLKLVHNLTLPVSCRSQLPSVQLPSLNIILGYSCHTTVAFITCCNLQVVPLSFSPLSKTPKKTQDLGDQFFSYQFLSCLAQWTQGKRNYSYV